MVGHRLLRPALRDCALATPGEGLRLYNVGGLDRLHSEIRIWRCAGFASVACSEANETRGGAVDQSSLTVATEHGKMPPPARRSLPSVQIGEGES